MAREQIQADNSKQIRTVSCLKIYGLWVTSGGPKLGLASCQLVYIKCLMAFVLFDPSVNSTAQAVLQIEHFSN